MKNQAGNLAPPFVYFGGKWRCADLIWDSLGHDIQGYIEPFCGSAAVLLAAPPGDRIETINDADGMVSNFWRAVRDNPDAVAMHADWPVNEADLMARHLWLLGQREALTERLMACPEYSDAKIAGWWVWGISCWIGGGWCSGDGPWQVVDGALTNRADGGTGVHRKLPRLGDGGTGVHRKLPHLGNGGTGVRRQLPHLGNGGQGVHRRSDCRRAMLVDWMGKLCDRLRGVRVACGDWQRVTGRATVSAAPGVTGVFLDPPYTEGNMQYAAGGVGGAVAQDVRGWAMRNTNNPRLRIVLAGHAGEHDALLTLGWRALGWSNNPGYGRSDEAAQNTASETLYLSPNCIAPLSLF